jgi:hypothetical protein
MQLLGLLLVASAVASQSGPVPNWGPAGHEIVASIAKNFLGTNATKLCKYLLPDIEGDIVQIANWADEVRRQPEYEWSGPCHFINTPDWKCNYSRLRDCHNDAGTQGYCVDGAIQNFTKRVQDSRLGQDQQAEALKFLVHFVGDIHQPLHVGFTTDEGGNTIEGTFEGQSTNLHVVWDTHMIVKRITDDYRGSQDSYVNWFIKQINGPWKNDAATWRQCPNPAPDNACSSDWASESIGLACTNAYVESDGKRHVPDGFRLADPYYNRNIPVIEEQLARAGVRLANVLNLIAPTALAQLAQNSQPIAVVS